VKLHCDPCLCHVPDQRPYQKHDPDHDLCLCRQNHRGLLLINLPDA
jgi:hypothetical protein